MQRQNRVVKKGDQVKLFPGVASPQVIASLHRCPVLIQPAHSAATSLSGLLNPTQRLGLPPDRASFWVTDNI